MSKRVIGIIILTFIISTLEASVTYLGVIAIGWVVTLVAWAAIILLFALLYLAFYLIQNN